MHMKTTKFYQVLFSSMLLLVIVTNSVCAQSKSAVEWLEEIRAAEKTEKADPEMDELRWGAIIHYYKGWTPDAEQQPAWDAFEKFYSEKGEVILKKIIEGTELTEKEKPYEWIMRGYALSKANKNGQLPNNYEIFGYCPDPQNVYERFAFTSIYLGRMTLKKAYSGLPLTQKDINALREYNIFLSNRHGHAEHLPHYFGMSRTTHYRAGEEFPDFYIKRYESVVNAPDFSDLGGAEWSWTERLKLIGIERMLQSIVGFSSERNKTGNIVVNPRAAEDNWADSNDNSFIRLSDFHGEKPIVIFLSDAKDVFCLRWFPAMETVYQAYKDKVEFFFINTSFDDWWSQETFYGKKVDSYYGDYNSSANILKLSYMRYPNVTVPGLLDNEASSIRDAFASAGGGGEFIIFDKEGKVAYQNPFGKLYGDDCHDEQYWLNDLEYEIRELLMNGEEYDSDRGWYYKNEIRAEMVHRSLEGIDHKGRKVHYFEYKQWPSGKLVLPIWFTGKITKIDNEKKQLTVKIEVDPKEMLGYKYNKNLKREAKLDPWAEKNMEVLDKWVNGSEADKTLVFDIDDSVELFLNALPAKMKQYRVGDYIAGRYGFMPDTFKDPDNPDSKGVSPPGITTTPQGYTRVRPEHLRVSHPIKPEASDFLRETKWHANDNGL